MSRPYHNQLRIRHQQDGITRAVGTVLNWVPAAFYGCLLASPFSTYAFTIGGNYIFEIPLALTAIFGLLVRDEIALATFNAIRYNQKMALGVLLMVTTLFVVGSLVGGNIAYAYGDYRANLMAVLGFLIGWQFRNEDPRPLIRFAICTGLFSCLAWRYNLSAGNLDETKFASPYTCLIVAIVLSCRARRVLPAFASLGILAFLAAISFYRQYWIAAGAGAVIILGFALSRFTAAARVRLVIAVLVAASIGALVFPVYVGKVESYFMDDESRYIQSIGKTTNLVSSLVNGNDTLQQSDQVRMAYFEFAATHPWKLILPHGLGYRWAFNNIDPFFYRLNFPVTTIDSLFFYISFHYGIVAMALLSIWIFLSMKKYIQSDGLIPTLGIGIVLSIALLFDGGQAVVISRAIWLGLLVSCVAKPLRIRRVFPYQFKNTAGAPTTENG